MGSPTDTRELTATDGGHDPAASTQPRHITAEAPATAIAPAAGEFARAVLAALRPSLDTFECILDDLHRRAAGDAAQLDSLSGALDRARQLAHQIEQFDRLCSLVRLSPERIGLDRALVDQLGQWQPALQRRGITLSQRIKPTQVVLDGALLVTLMDSAIAWCANRGRQLQVRLEVKLWPEHAQLAIRASGDDAAAASPPVDDIDWLLLVQAAAVAGVSVARELTAGGALLAIEFPNTVAQHEAPGITSLDTERRLAPVGLRPAARSPQRGRKALLITDDARLRLNVVEQCRQFGLEVEFAPNVSEAIHLVQEHAPPTLLIVDENQKDGAFVTLHHRLLASHPELPTIEITNLDSGLHVPAWGDAPVSRVARDAVRRHLSEAIDTVLQGR